MKHICTSCGYIYDQEKGDPESGHPKGTKFDDLDENWVCPTCYVTKDQFDPLD